MKYGRSVQISLVNRGTQALSKHYLFFGAAELLQISLANRQHVGVPSLWHPGLVPLTPGLPKPDSTISYTEIIFLYTVGAWSQTQ